jgi:alpha-tubulin suppressor-like RCC1 family protein
VNAGLSTPCALRKAAKGNSAYCWGQNAYGDLGDGTTDPSKVPVLVRGMSSGVTSIVPYYNTTCAVQRGAAKCWGYNIYGMVGDGSTASCALRTTGGIRCWGFGDDGQLGDGKELLSYTPVRVHLT